MVVVSLVITAVAFAAGADPGGGGGGKGWTCGYEYVWGVLTLVCHLLP